MDKPLEEASEFFRVYAWAAGRVLSEADIADVQKVLADYNTEIGNATDAYHQARRDVLLEIGGEALVKAADEALEWQSAVSLTKALEHFYRKSAEYATKAKAAPAA